MQSLNEIYTAEWFAHDFEHLQPEFNVVADSLIRQFAPESVVDVGCGPGMVLKRLRERGVEVTGLEGSQHGINYADESIRYSIYRMDFRNFKDPVTRPPVFGDAMPTLLICTEVLEHIEPEHADNVVAFLCSFMVPMVITAAPPGQDGHYHVNCQPWSYWAPKFTKHGVVEDYVATSELRRRWEGLERLSHMPKNLHVMR